MDTSVKLELRFGTETGKTRTLSVNQPAQNLEPAFVQSAMETIAAQGIFQTDGERLYDSVKGARYVTREVEEIFDAAQA